jgi:hypothetical protein
MPDGGGRDAGPQPDAGDAGYGLHGSGVLCTAGAAAGNEHAAAGALSSILAVLAIRRRNRRRNR